MQSIPIIFRVKNTIFLKNVIRISVVSKKSLHTRKDFFSETLILFARDNRIRKKFLSILIVCARVYLKLRKWRNFHACLTFTVVRSASENTYFLYVMIVKVIISAHICKNFHGKRNGLIITTTINKTV